MHPVIHLGISASHPSLRSLRISIRAELTLHFNHQSTTHRLEHLALLLRTPSKPSAFESLPTEIIVYIAQIAQDEHVKKSSPILGKSDTGPCCTSAATSATKHLFLAKEVLSLGGTSRRLRAVLVHAGFFRSISIQGNVDQLFAASIVATDGLLAKAELVVLRLAYRGPQDAPLDATNLRRALDLYTDAKHMYIKWNTSLATSPIERLPPLPPTRPTAPVAPKPSSVRSLFLSLSGCAMNVTPTPSPKAQADTRQIIQHHLCQLVPVVVTSSVRELDLMIAFSDTGISVRDGLSVFVDSLEGMQRPGLTRLGVTGFFDVDSREEVSGKWLPTLERLLVLAPQVSSTITDLEVILAVRINSTAVFTYDPITDAPSLPGLIPLRHQVVEMLHRLSNADVKIVPFTIRITAETALLPVGSALLLLEYIPASYNTPEASALLSKRNDVGFESATATSLMDSPETRRVLGGDDLRFAPNRSGFLEVFGEVVEMELNRI